VLSGALLAGLGLAQVASAGAPGNTASEWQKKGDEARRQKEFPRAAEAYQRCLALEPEHLDCTLRLASTTAQLAARTGDLEKSETARRLYQRFLALAPPDHPQAAKVRALLEQQPAQVDEKPPSTGSPTGAPAESPEDLAREGGLARSSGDPERAVMHFEKCLAAAPTHLECLRGLAGAWEALAAVDDERGAMEKSRAFYRRYLELAPPNDPHVPGVRALLGSRGPGASMGPLATGQVELKRGSTMEVDLPVAIQRVAVGSADILEVNQVGPQRLSLTGLEQGTTMVLAWFVGGYRKSIMVIVR
jgi:tetratricopeptide (TPR) repeat protein